MTTTPHTSSGPRRFAVLLAEQVEFTDVVAPLQLALQQEKGVTAQIETFLARKQVGDGGTDPSAPEAAGGAL